MKKGGFPGGMGGNMQGFMKQVQKMQAQMTEQAKILTQTEFEGTAGGNAVVVKMLGGKKITSIKISKDVVDPDDIEMLEDLIIAAVNEAGAKVDKETNDKMSGITGSMDGLNGLI